MYNQYCNHHQILYRLHFYNFVSKTDLWVLVVVKLLISAGVDSNNFWEH